MPVKYSSKLKNFKSITLNQLNATASFLKRIDKKFLLNSKQFALILEDLKENFNVLEINGKKVFNYDNVYMDTADYLFYNQHQNKLESRTKIRTRYYVDSNIAFFEYKQKNNGITNKYRYEFPASEHGFMTRGKKRFFDGVWQSVYAGEKAPDISPAIKTTYKRITMVSKAGDERLTIDFDIKALDLRKKNAETVDLKNLVIVESKSMKEDSDICKTMAKHKIEKAHSCSKYSLGVVYSGIADKYDTFRETMEKIKEIRMETIKNTNRVTSLNSVTKNITKEITKPVGTFTKKEIA
ncbi:MAG: polyphosphate polymerase domain-containing protein [Candidatus Gracilibacteria bacterium]|nr:polyphosphate polymerase domain-containing protein [Candidatus Gracilibacteria bacterium]